MHDSRQSPQLSELMHASGGKHYSTRGTVSGPVDSRCGCGDRGRACSLCMRHSLPSGSGLAHAAVHVPVAFLGIYGLYCQGALLYTAALWQVRVHPFNASLKLGLFQEA